MTQPSNKRRSVNHAGGRRRTGSLQFRTKSWRAVLTVEVDGEKIRKWVNLDTDNKAVARRKLAKLIAADPSALQEAATTPETYGELATRVRKLRRDSGVKDCSSEETHEDNWIFDEIGHLAVEAIRPSHILGIYEMCAGKGRSESHLRHLRTVLKSRFDRAVVEGTIATSPTANVQIPKAKNDTRERAVLTDIELAVYLAWQHPRKGFQLAVLQRQTMSALSRMFGGLRTGDLHGMRWEHFNVPDFTVGKALRRKTARPQSIEVPEDLRPILKDWWARSAEGQPKEGFMFPLLRGDGADKKEAKKKVSHAQAMRRDLQAAFKAHRLLNAKVAAEVLDTIVPAPDSARWNELFKNTDLTRPVDFHSWRRRFVQVLGDIGLNAQQAQKLAGHANLAAHERYLNNTSRTLSIPFGALPDLRVNRSGPLRLLDARLNNQASFQSGWWDLNSQQPAPKAGPLPG